MDLSLIICTRNRALQLPACLAAVTQMAKPAGFELVIVNNGSGDETESVLRRFKATSTFPVTICEEPTPGLSRARNAGWRASKGEIIAFTDDDCYVAEDYAEQVVQLFEMHDIAYFAGKILLFDPEDYPLTIQLRSKDRHFAPRQVVPCGAVQGANFGFTRTALIECGGFDDRLGSGTPFPCEDIEIVGRLSAAGRSGLYSPLPSVYHHHRRRAGPDITNLRKQYDAGRGAYYAAMMMIPGMRLRAFMSWAPRAIKRGPLAALREISAAYRYVRSGAAPKHTTGITASPPSMI